MIHLKRTKNITLVNRLDYKCFGDEHDPYSYSEDTYWFIVYYCGYVAGYAGLEVIQTDTFKYGYLLRAGILPAYRGNGLQRALIRARDKYAKRLGLACNITYVANWNHASANSLIRCGYTLYTPQRKWGLRGSLYFRKELC